MKKLLSVFLSLCMIFGLALSVNASVDNIVADDFIDTEENIVDIATKDLATGDITYSTIDCSEPEATLYSNGTIGNYRPGWFPNMDDATSSEGDGASTCEVLGGSDERTLVSDTEIFPYSAICYIEAEWDELVDDPYQGTAWMLGPNLAVTSAHNIYVAGCGVADSVTVWPGKCGRWIWNNPFGSSDVDNIKYPVKYETVGTIGYDWAVLQLEEDLGNETGWFGFGWYADEYPVGEPITITGYPGPDEDYPTEEFKQYTMSGVIDSIDRPDQAAEKRVSFRYTIDTGEGQSGSPVYSYRYSQYIVYGIHRKYDGYSYNYATRITNEIFVCLDRILEIPTISEEVFP